jgi:hypothetical protein
VGSLAVIRWDFTFQHVSASFIVRENSQGASSVFNQIPTLVTDILQLCQTRKTPVTLFVRHSLVQANFTMIFQYTLSQVLSETKTQTRRVIKPGEQALRGKNNRILTVLDTNGREKWSVGKTYSVQPARAKAGVACIIIRSIRSEAVTRISTSDAKSEGFSSRQEFLAAWKAIHGENMLNCRVWIITFELTAIAESAFAILPMPEKLSEHAYT